MSAAQRLGTCAEPFLIIPFVIQRGSFLWDVYPGLFPVVLHSVFCNKEKIFWFGGFDPPVGTREAAHHIIASLPAHH